MSVQSCSLPWTTRLDYHPIQTYDEETNKSTTTGVPGLSRPRSRLLNRVIRVVNALLTVGLLAYLCMRPSMDLTLSMLHTSILDLTEPGIDSSLSHETTVPSNVDWSKYAYIQYVTNSIYLCSSLMIFESLHRLGSKAERLMMYPEEWSALCLSGYIVLCRDTDFDQPMDELFFLPQAPVAMPRAYWLDSTLSSQLMVIQPSQTEFERVRQAVDHRNATDFDMEVVNKLYNEECLVLPPQKYNLITGEFRNHEHRRYIDSSTEKWDAHRALKEAKYLHFSDWPYPKPWSEYSHVTHDRLQPDCGITLEGEEDCSSRDIWDEIYDEFLSRRQRVCGSRYMPD